MIPLTIVDGPQSVRAFGAWDPRQASGRLLSALLLGGITAGLLQRLAFSVRAIAAWDAAGFVLLCLSWLVIWRASPDTTRCRAAAEDPGRRMAWVIVVVASIFSLFAAAVVLRSAKTLAPQHHGLLAALCLGAVVISWLLTHTSWALRYAHLYYRDDTEGIGGLLFPGNEPPDAFDFAYFAFGVGMCFQVGDVSVTSRQIRRAVLFHATISFAYNTAILALALNLTFGMLN